MGEADEEKTRAGRERTWSGRKKTVVGGVGAAPALA